jgi:excisionase family DNA binding protein
MSAAEETEKPVMLVQELARLLDVSPKTIYSMVQHKQIPGVLWAGRLLRFRRAVVIAWLNGENDSDPPRRGKR